jgi:hypothetical protein
MRSPLEHEPALLAGVGLITVRWAMLEHQLADLLGRLMAVDHGGDAAYYSLGNFTQRLDLIEGALDYSLRDDRQRAIASSLFRKIRRLWKARNYLIHSHYVHQVELKDGTTISMLEGHEAEATDLLEGLEPTEIKWHGFSYVKHSSNGKTNTVPVNAGTFKNHAAQLSKRARQVAAFRKAIDTKVAELREGASTSYRSISPRSPSYPQFVTPDGEAFTVRMIPGRSDP